MKLSESTVKRVWMHWLRTKMPLNIRKFGRKKKELDSDSVQLILEVNKEQNLGARRLEKIIDFKYGKHIPHNAIHRVLLAHGRANVNRNKAKRRKPWVRWERDHSLTLVHLDWHDSDINGKKACAVLDDSSRRILAGGEFDEETSDNSIHLLQEALDNFGWLTSISQVMTDHGTQVNGKFEKWNDTYEKNRIRFDNFDEFMNWYNTVRFHESLDTKWYLQTPDMAFWARLPEGCKLGMFLKYMETELNGGN
jgi:transposase InsO family protein